MEEKSLKSNHEKTKNLIKAMGFVIIFLLLLQTVTYIIRTNGDVKDRFVGFYGEPKNTIDVIMIGSSPTYPCYSGPMLYQEHGFTAYPLATNRQRPQAALPLVKEALKTQSPSLFIFEVKQFAADETMMTDNMAYTRGVTDNMKYSWNRVETINAMVPVDGPEPRYTYYFDIFKYHSNWKTMVLPSQLRCFRYEHQDPLKGYLFKEEVLPAAYVDYSTITQTSPIPTGNEESMRELLDYLQANNLHALFLLSPYQMEDEEKQKNFNYIAETVRSYGYEFLDLNRAEYLKEMDFDFQADFADGGVHTNAVGSEKVTAWFGEYLKTHYDLPDHRGDSTYTSWEDAGVTWNQRLEEAKEKIRYAIENKTYADAPVEQPIEQQ